MCTGTETQVSLLSQNKYTQESLHTYGEVSFLFKLICMLIRKTESFVQVLEKELMMNVSVNNKMLFFYDSLMTN